MELWNFWAGKNDVNLWRDIKRLSELIEQNQCRRCGVHLIRGSDLWCKKCRERVDEELDGQISRPFEYYFRHHIKRWKKKVN